MNITVKVSLMILLIIYEELSSTHLHCFVSNLSPIPIHTYIVYILDHQWVGVTWCESATLASTIKSKLVYTEIKVLAEGEP